MSSPCNFNSYQIIFPSVFLLTSSKGRPSLNIILSSADMPLGRSPPVAATCVAMVNCKYYDIVLLVVNQVRKVR